MSEERLVERFVRLCGIRSVTGEERAMTDALAAELAGLGIECHEDDAAGPARAGAGNLIARIPPASEATEASSGEMEGSSREAPWIAFFAHVDTVPHEEPIVVVEEGGVLRSAGPTILGADNKAAVTVLMELAARLVAEPAQVGVELVFTVAEEQGLRGAAALDVDLLSSESGYVLDHATPIGEVIIAAPTYKKLVAEFRGVESHAGIRPEDGRSAIAAATAAIATMDLGRLDEETTANIGVIDGGTAPNVVAGRCRVEGEARSLDAGRAEDVAQTMVDACSWAAGQAGVDVDLLVETYFRGYRIKPSSRPLAIARAALESCGVEPIEVTTGGGSDANALRAAGFDALLLANGTAANHTPNESVSVEALARMLDVCAAIVAGAGRS
ncbi:MAG TPA: M20/M25/M40 family metallo-hydrolase [Solirubrobacterales bacterium]|nr:M20/M25/M40 family metallo-hydrolase [Solirubrobacterales bacterium]